MSAKRKMSARMAKDRLKRDVAASKEVAEQTHQALSKEDLPDHLTAESCLGAIANALKGSQVLQRGEQMFAYPPLKVVFYYNYHYMLRIDLQRTDKRDFWDAIDLDALVDLPADESSAS